MSQATPSRFARYIAEVFDRAKVPLEERIDSYASFLRSRQLEALFPASISPTTRAVHEQEFRRYLEALGPDEAAKGVHSLLTEAVRTLSASRKIDHPSTSTSNPTTPSVAMPSAEDQPKKVFVVHGHDTSAKVEVARTLERLGLGAIILHEQADKGRTVIEKFEQNAAGASFAVVLLTPDDEGHAAKAPHQSQPRARQNVVLELGYFIGKLGRNKVCVLRKGAVEQPSDILGVVYTPFDDAGAWRLTLAREIKSAGIAVDLNRL